MTTLINDRRTAAVVDVAGVTWPVRKLAAVVVALVAVVGVVVAGGSFELAAWIAAGAGLAVWWGGFLVQAPRWEHGRREHAVARRTYQH